MGLFWEEREKYLKLVNERCVDCGKVLMIQSEIELSWCEPTCKGCADKWKKKEK